MRTFFFTAGILLALTATCTEAQNMPAPALPGDENLLMVTEPRNTCAPLAAAAPPSAAQSELLGTTAQQPLVTGALDGGHVGVTEGVLGGVTEGAPGGVPSVIPGAPVLATAGTAMVILKPRLEMQCADDKIKVALIGEVNINHYTGQKIPVTLELTGAPGVAFDLESLDTVDNESGFLIAAKAIRVEGDTVSGTKVTINLTVQSFELGKNWLPLSLTLKYATAFAPQGTPLWQDLVTPDLILLRHDTALQNVKTGLLLGNHSLATARTSWAYIPSLVIGLALLGLAALLFVVRQINRLRPRPALSPQSATWLSLDEVVSSGNKIGFSQKHYESISTTLKGYLKTLYPHLDSFEPSTIETALAGQDAQKAIVNALGYLKSVVYDGEKLSPDQHCELLSQLRTIVPKPLSI